MINKPDKQIFTFRTTRLVLILGSIIHLSNRSIPQNGQNGSIACRDQSNQDQQTIRKQNLHRHHISFVRSPTPANLTLPSKSTSRGMFHHPLEICKTTPPRHKRTTKKASSKNRLENPLRLDENPMLNDPLRSG